MILKLKDAIKLGFGIVIGQALATIAIETANNICKRFNDCVKETETESSEESKEDVAQ